MRSSPKDRECRGSAIVGSAKRAPSRRRALAAPKSSRGVEYGVIGSRGRRNALYDPEGLLRGLRGEGGNA
jgi:hypothetical protein